MTLPNLSKRTADRDNYVRGTIEITFTKVACGCSIRTVVGPCDPRSREGDWWVHNARLFAEIHTQECPLNEHQLDNERK